MIRLDAEHLREIRRRALCRFQARRTSWVLSIDDCPMEQWIIPPRPPLLSVGKGLTFGSLDPAWGEEDALRTPSTDPRLHQG